MTEPATHVELRGITKRFGGTVALDGIDLTIARGTVHALVGENGAGKSTVGKLITGIHTADAGDLLLAGEPVHFKSPRQALDHGCTIVAQELSLVPARTVIENVYLGFEDHLGPVVRRRVLQKKFRELVEVSGIDVPGDRIARDLTVADQQKTEILRALARRAELVVMDEPTARLTAGEADGLMSSIRRLTAAGTTVVFVSHFLEEVLGIADTITIMRDGRIVRTCTPAGETKSNLIESMIGRSLDSNFPPKAPPAPGGVPVLRVQNLTRQHVFQDVSLHVDAGEIVVMAGLVGAGRSEVARAIYGAEHAESGSVELDGHHLGGSSPSVRSPTAAIAAGIAMIPESRKTQGLQLLQSVERNITLPHLRRLSQWGVVRLRQERKESSRIATSVGVKTAGVSSGVTTLSGGNQQKVLFARSLMVTPRLLIADEPTRGVDVGSKRAIYDLIAELAAAGTGVLVISSELDEVVGLAHRVIVMSRGRITGELTGAEITDANIMASAFAAAPATSLGKSS